MARRARYGRDRRGHPRTDPRSRRGLTVSTQAAGPFRYLMRPLRSAEIDSPRAWIVVVSAFMSCFTLFGVSYSFGAFFRPMGAEFGASRMPTAAVFSITAGIYNALGAPAGHL